MSDVDDLDAEGVRCEAFSDAAQRHTIAQELFFRYVSSAAFEHDTLEAAATWAFKAADAFVAEGRIQYRSYLLSHGVQP